MTKKINTVIQKTARILLWIIGGIFGLFLLIVLLIQIPFIQNFAKDKAVAFLEEKIKTKVSVERLQIGLPKKIILEGFYFESQQKDTLLAGDRLALDISLFKLINNELEINSVNLQGVVANISRDQDSTFNFQYIIDAFATTDPKKPSGEPLRISVSKIDLDNIRFNYKDAISKNDINLNLTHFDTGFKEFDLDAMKFDIPNIRLDGLKVVLNQGLVEKIAKTSVEVADTISKRPDFRINLGKIELSRINLVYDNVGTHLNTGLQLGKLLLEFNEIDLNTQLIDVDNFELEDIKGNLLVGKYDQPIEVPETDTTAIKQKGWRVKLNDIGIRNINFKYDDANSAPIARGMDYKHLDIKDFQLEAKNLYYSTDTLSGNIGRFAMTEKSGLVLENLRTKFFYGARGAYLKDLYMKTPLTLIKNEIVIEYPSIESLSSNPGEMYLNAVIENSTLALNDILIFVPTLATQIPFDKHSEAVLYVNTRISGKLNDIRFPVFQISGLGNTIVSASGSITGLPDMNKAYFDIDIDRFRTTAHDVRMLTPRGTVPSNLSLPSQFALTGNFTGAVNNFNTNVNLTSSYGNASVKAKFDQRVKKREKYNADVKLTSFNLGKLIKNDSIGRISLSAKVNGTGLDPQSATATLDGILQQAQYNGYTYKDLRVNGDIDKGQFKVDAAMDDPNLNFDLAANGGFNDKYPAVKLRLNVDIADLEKLNLHAGPLKLKGNVDADITNSDPDYLNGDVAIHHVQFLKDEDPVILDSISLSARTTADSSMIKVKSQFVRLDANGKFNLSQLGNALQNSISKYYKTGASTKAPDSPQQVDFTLKVDNDPIIYKLMPQITGLEPIQFKGSYNSVGDSITVAGSFPRIVYGNTIISGGDLNIDTKDSALVYQVNVDAIDNEQFLIPKTSLSGIIKENQVGYNLSITDKKNKEQYAIVGTMKSEGGNTEVHLDPDKLVLDYNNWTVDENNILRFGKNGVYAKEFNLSHEGITLSAQSKSEGVNAPLEINFKDFTIETLLNMVKKEAPMASGLLNGEVVLSNLTSNPVFTSDLTINDFHFRKELVGDIRMQVHNQVADTYTADVAITGNGNQVDLDGTYKANTQSFNLDLDIAHLEVKSIQGFTFDAIEDGSGFLSGKMKITGTTADPDVAGDLNFNNVALRVTTLNSYFKDINEKIVVDNQGFTFDSFRIYDEKNNPLTLNGKLLTTDYKSYTFDLALDAENFRAVNSKAKDNDLYYGDLFIDTNLKIKGSMDSPEVSGRLKINEDTKFTVVLPQTDPSIADREGIVEFVDEDNVLLQETMVLKNTVDKSDVKGMDVSVSIEIVKEAMLSLVIDKGNGDFLNLQGEAELQGGIDKSGKTTLTGRYEFTEGAYEMTFNLIKRRFDIKPGSYIVWNGEPTMADINVTAIYNVNAAPIDLLDNQLGGVSQSIRNTYKQKIPFQTLLKMNGELLKPLITFDIILPEGNHNVSGDIVTASRAKLEQLRQEPSEMNKQVFALLLMNRFIGENPFASEAGSGGAEALARQSVSKILSQQMNNLAADLIKGVELNFDLESTEDYTSGLKENRTDLNVGVSKRLLNDRLKVTVGSSFGLEGQQQQNRDATNIAGDIALDYQLTEDGRYLVRAYRKNEYQVALQGQIVETGVAFILTMDYNQFRELFHRTQEEKEMKQRERERKKQRKEREKAQKEKENNSATKEETNEN